MFAYWSNALIDYPTTPDVYPNDLYFNRFCQVKLYKLTLVSCIVKHCLLNWSKW